MPLMRNPPIARRVTFTQIVTVYEIVTPFWPLENVTIMNGDSMFQGHTRSLKTKNSMKIKKRRTGANRSFEQLFFLLRTEISLEPKALFTFLNKFIRSDNIILIQKFEQNFQFISKNHLIDADYVRISMTSKLGLKRPFQILILLIWSVIKISNFWLRAYLK